MLCKTVSRPTWVRRSSGEAIRERRKRLNGFGHNRNDHPSAESLRHRKPPRGSGDDHLQRRLRLSGRGLKDASEPQHNLYIHVHTDDEGKALAPSCQKAHAVIIPHAERHRFLDGTVGVRLEQEDPVAVLPVRMKRLLSANDCFFAGERKDMCSGCRTAVASRFDKFGKVCLSVSSA
ncbi:hypothetical protein FIBSPDRAFT_1037934 [Athelia psychrophila]|uniref:Uncharacterized protein n=1 Tax=Athelia psychrophila TaxID=1759441 RepID=A0A166TXV8_9AGAM|nr:hypothetical protein FIBSPDRAFT_1037934 [Fibularhizoctonia sp. CBS 109695]